MFDYFGRLFIVIYKGINEFSELRSDWQTLVEASPHNQEHAGVVCASADLDAFQAELAAPAASQSKKRTADEAALGTQWYDVAAASSSDPAPVGAHAALAAAAAIADAAVGGSAMP